MLPFRMFPRFNPPFAPLPYPASSLFPTFFIKSVFLCPSFHSRLFTLPKRVFMQIPETERLIHSFAKHRGWHAPARLAQYPSAQSYTQDLPQLIYFHALPHSFVHIGGGGTQTFRS